MKLEVADVYAAGQVKHRASIVQSKTQRPVSFEITIGTRKAVATWLDAPLMVGSQHLWPGRFHQRLHISTRQYARLVRGRRSRKYTARPATYAVQLLPGHTKMDSTVRYLGVELEDALAIAEAVEL